MEEWDERYSFYHYQRPEKASGGWITGGGIFVDLLITCLFLFVIGYFLVNYAIGSFHQYRLFQQYVVNAPRSALRFGGGSSTAVPASNASLPPLPSRMAGGGVRTTHDGDTPTLPSRPSGQTSREGDLIEVQRLRRELEEKNTLLRRIAQTTQTQPPISSTSSHQHLPDQQQGHFFQGASFFGFGNGSPPRSAAARALFTQAFSHPQVPLNFGMATPQAPPPLAYNPPFSTPQPSAGSNNPFQSAPTTTSASTFPPVASPFPGDNNASAGFGTNAFSQVSNAGPSTTPSFFRGSVFHGDVGNQQFRATEQQQNFLFSQQHVSGGGGFPQVGTGFNQQPNAPAAESAGFFPCPQSQPFGTSNNNNFTNNNNNNNDHNNNNNNHAMTMNPFGSQQQDLNRQFFNSEHHFEQQTRPTVLEGGDRGGEPNPRNQFSPAGVPAFGGGGATRRSGATGRMDMESPIKGGGAFERPAEANKAMGRGGGLGEGPVKGRPPLSTVGRFMATQRVSEVERLTMNNQTPMGRTTGFDNRRFF